MDLHSEFTFSLLTNGLYNMLSKCFVDIRLVVINCYMSRVQVPNVHQHLYWVPDCHQKVVHLVKSMVVGNNYLEPYREELPIPIQEPTPSCFPDICFPVANVVKDFVLEVKLEHFFLIEDVSFGTD